MIDGLNLNIEEESLIWNNFLKWSKRFKEKLKINGFNFLFEQYDQFITSIELASGVESKPSSLIDVKPYNTKRDVSEYGNYLTSREAIQIIMDSVSTQEQKRLTDIVNELDNRFERLLVGDEFIFDESKSQEYPKDKFWWYYGYPSIIK